VKTKYVYLGCAIVFAASLLAIVIFHYFPVSVVGDLAGIPAIVALFGALFQLSRDNIAFERSLLIEETKNRFAVGAMSHMANVAFDKHVLFCEEYTTAAYGAMATLFRRGPHEDALVEASTLSDIRLKWTVWLAPDVIASLCAR
jgi:cadmium resistance protein CadD (predicted permease)